MEPAGPPSNEHLLQLERLLGAASWRVSEDGLWCSPNLFPLFGMEEFTPTMQTFEERMLPRLHPDDVEPLEQFVADLSGEDRLSIEFRFMVGEVERSFVASVENTEGVRIGFIRDVTSQRKTEREKLRAESMFKTLADELPAGIYLGTLEGVSKYANPALLELFETDSHEEIDWDELIHPEDQEHVEERFQEFIDEGEVAPYRFRVVINGKHHTLEARKAWVPGTDETLMVSNLTDQTETDLRERRLLDSERQLEWSQRISNTGTWNVRFRPHEIEWSPSFYRMLERDPETFVVTDSSFFEHIAEGSRDESERVVNEIISKKQTWDFPVQFTTASGRKIWARSVGEPVLDDDGELIGLRGVVQDISEMHDLQERVRRAEKFQALGELAGGIAHDFNNMLAAILGNAEILASELTGEALLDCREIIDTARRCGDLTNQLLAFSRRRPLESREIDIAQSVETVLGLVQHGIQGRVNVNVTFPDNPSLVAGEASLIENALLNVCLNAIQAMPRKGELSIEVEHTTLARDDWGEEFDVVEGPAIAIRVRDTGVGISEENLARVLDPFFSTRRESGGTGLGLATTFGAVRNHGGAMKISSQQNVGTCVTIVLPAASDTTLSDSKEFSVDSLDLKGVSVLVVDDELSVRRIVSRHLRAMGAEPDSAGGHREALELIQRRGAAGEEYDIGIFDLSMPDGRGTDTAETFKQSWPHGAVLIISGFDVNVALEGADYDHHVLQKPFTKKGLARAIGVALGLFE